MPVNLHKIICVQINRCLKYIGSCNAETYPYPWVAAVASIWCFQVHCWSGWSSVLPLGRPDPCQGVLVWPQGCHRTSASPSPLELTWEDVGAFQFLCPCLLNYTTSMMSDFENWISQITMEIQASIISVVTVWLMTNNKILTSNITMLFTLLDHVLIGRKAVLGMRSSKCSSYLLDFLVVDTRPCLLESHWELPHFGLEHPCFPVWPMWGRVHFFSQPALIQQTPLHPWA